MTQYPNHHLMAKPAGAVCNLDCTYCYYLDKERLYATHRMTPDVLEAYVRQFIAAQEADEIVFAWQGGEPTLAGLAFYEEAVRLQARYTPPGKRVLNTLQTNATLLDDAWGAFLARQGFLVGVSVDGPALLHDHHRVNKGGQPTHHLTMRGLDVLRRHGVEYNLLTTVNAHNARHPREVYEHLRGLGTPYLQFIPVVEWHAGEPTPESVTADALGEFLREVFDLWLARDVGRISLQIVDHMLHRRLFGTAGSCVFSPECGAGLALEHNGDVYACDHYVEPAHLLGNLTREPLADLVNSERQIRFGQEKRTTLPDACLACPVLDDCWGDCPKHRRAPDGRSVLCGAYRSFFAHVTPHADAFARQLRAAHAPERTP